MLLICNKATVCTQINCPHREKHSEVQYEESADDGMTCMTNSCTEEEACYMFPGEDVKCLEVKEED